ncbi:hypothetical protein KDH_59840 [Dictyobacter sp. S3.2.2.5]|uniref:Peptidase S53 domain-containing protein n=1 Tax=Dictyobacter halimunensis TaxID=3026934 RepID=A0ABQ6G0V7_9CHLR|nr:hypothetical protein KDH_59840 [Dictyobacter sp. S3.2.2.5]
MEATVSDGDKKHQSRSFLKRPISYIPVIGLVLALVVGYFSGFNPLNNAHAAGIQTLPGIKTKLTQSSKLGSTVDANTPVKITIGLRMHNQADLQQYVNNISNTKNKTARSLTKAQLIETYSPYPAEQQAVINYMNQYGFKTTETFDHRLVIGFSGTIGQAESAFNVSENYYTTKDGHKFYASTTEPGVPSAIAPYITTIQGLDNVTHFTHTPITPVQPGGKSPQAVSNATVSCPANGQNNAYPTYYAPSQITNGYNLSNVQQTYKGNGQMIGLVEFADYLPSDAAAYASCYGGKTVPISRIAADGMGSTPYDSGMSEAELDIELALSTAPQLANINVYEAQNTSQGNLLMWGKIISDAVPVVSTSWSSCEPNTTPSDVQQENSLFMIAAAQGQSILASAGDNGSTDCLGANNDTSLQVGDPASQPYVTAVGGTTLHTNSTGGYGSENVWNNTQGLPSAQQQQAAGGGGISQLWPMPDYQQGIVNGSSSGTPCNATSGYCREVPDVSFNADPDSGYPIYTYNCTSASCTGPAWYIYGGTSTSAPMYASLVALANQYSLSKGYYNIGFLNPLLYSLHTRTPGDFHDITTGNNNIVSGTQYSATSGYDLATGLGSPANGNLFTDLANLADSQTGQRQTPAATKWYFAEGNVGNGFQEFLSILNPNITQAANVKVTYLFPNGRAPIVKMHTVTASTRGTVSLMSDLNYPDTGTAQTSVSTIVESVANSNGVAVPIIAERPMYFNFANRVYSGTDVFGANAANQTNFYFPAGDTRLNSTQNYNTFITLLNPNSTTANITATYYANGSVVGTQTMALGSMARGTLTPPGHQQMAMKVTSSIGIVAERPMYFKDTVANQVGPISGAGTTIGATGMGKDWLFAVGNTQQSNYQEYLVLANFTGSDTTAQVQLEYTNGQVQSVSVQVKAYSQLYFDVNSYRAQFRPGTDGVAAAVHDDDGAIVAESLVYFNYNSTNNQSPTTISGILDTIGQPSATGYASYSFAEGYTAGYNTEYLTLLNQSSNKVHVVVTLYADNTIIQKTVELTPLQITSLNVNSIIVPIAKAYPAGGANNVSITVQALDGTVVAERVYYFLSDNIKHGGTSMFGYTNS